MDWWIVAMVAIQASFLAFLIWVGVNYRQKSQQRRSEERLRIVERFDSGKDLSNFLESERGARFMELFAIQHKDPAGLLIAGTVIGILALFVGGALFYINEKTGEDFIIAAVMVITGGLGTLTATGVSYFLARRFGLLHTQSDVASDLSEAD